MRGNEAIQKLMEYTFSTVLDVGCGNGVHSNIFQQNHKQVTAVNLFKVKNLNVIIGDYNDIKFNKQFDCIWACHILEHQLNPNLFLKKIHNDLKQDGILCITTPPLKTSIVGGHYTIWNAGLIVYNLIMAGFNCKNIRIKRYGYNISIILKKQDIQMPEDLPHDKGELEIIADFAPSFFKQNFNGNIEEYNW